MIWNFDKYKENIAFIDEYGNQMTYGQLEEFGKRLANVCSGNYEAGITESDITETGITGLDIMDDPVAKEKKTSRCLVFCMSTNSIGSAAGYAGFVNNGIVPLMLNAHMDETLRESLIATYQPKFIWRPAEGFTEKVTEHATDNTGVHMIAEQLEKQVPDEGQNGGQIVFKAYGYELVRTPYASDYPLYDDLCLLLTTSGSTGSPKFVRQSYTNVKSNAEAIVEYLKLDSSERPISTLPMNYTYGLSIINSHLLVGATILLTDKGLMQKEFWSFFNDQQATSFGGVPYTYEMLERLRFNRRDLPSLRYMTQAGGKLSPALHEKFSGYCKEKGYRFIVMYGQCEATARMGYLPWEKSIEKNGSMGIAIPGGKFTLIDTDGSVIDEPDVAGELVYEGDNVTLGYATCIEDLNKGDERGGILHTGDVAKRDRDGYYYIVGRMKRFLKIYGNRVNLDEIDQLIKADFNGIEVATSGIDDHMYIFLTDKVNAEEVRKYVIEKTKLNPAAFKTVVIDEIPKNDAGKVLYRKLEEYYKRD